MVVVEGNNRNLMVVVWLCYSSSCIEINFGCGLDVGSMKGRRGVDVGLMWWRENRNKLIVEEQEDG